MILDLGIDAGGSKADWLARDGAGTDRVRGRAAAIQAAAQDPQAVARALAAIVAAAESASGMRVASLVAGIAGAGLVAIRRGLRAACARELGDALPLAIVGDCEVAAATALADGPGLAVWAGTGSFCIARAEDGSLHRAGGRGLLLDDRGGAAALVLAAARAAVESDDGVRGPTTLCAALAGAFGAARARELGRVLRDVAPGALAAQLALVTGAAAAGDAVATEVLARESEALAARATAAVRRAGLVNSAVPITLGGGAFEHHAPLRAAFLAALRREGFVAEPRGARDAVLGAVALARALRERTRPECSWLEDEHAA